MKQEITFKVTTPYQDRTAVVTGQLKVKFQDIRGVDIRPTPSTELPPKGAMGDPITLGLLTITFLESALPGIVKGIREWLLGNQEATKLRVKKGDNEIELEIPDIKDTEAVEALTERLLKQLE
ncbi:MAG: hypothetical protein AAGG75_04100 [Bacteroidota bacterium]